VNEIEKLHLWAAEKLGPDCCKPDCGESASRVRFWPNPLWGFDKDGATPLDEAGFVLDLQELITTGDDPGHEVGFRLAQCRRFCLLHFEDTVPTARRAVNPNEPAKPAGANPKTNLLTGLDQRREKALDVYGRVCVDCGEANTDLLQLVLAPGQPADLWARLGVQGFSGKYQLLATRCYPSGLCVVRCDSCVGRALTLSAAEPSAARELRTRVLAAYGGECRRCGRLVGLWLVKKPGVEKLRYPGGRTVSSRDKYRALAQAGFPGTHELLCRGCFTAERGQGQGGDPT
jgi:hypothetical protein